jgi:hypothetical protein
MGEVMKRYEALTGRSRRMSPSYARSPMSSRLDRSGELASETVREVAGASRRSAGKRFPARIWAFRLRIGEWTR